MEQFLATAVEVEQLQFFHFKEVGDMAGGIVDTIGKSEIKGKSQVVITVFAVQDMTWVRQNGATVHVPKDSRFNISMHDNNFTTQDISGLNRGDFFCRQYTGTKDSGKGSPTKLYKSFIKKAISS